MISGKYCRIPEGVIFSISLKICVARISAENIYLKLLGRAYFH